MAASAQSVIEIEAFSCLRQSIACFIIMGRTRAGLEADHLVVLQACAQFFNLGLVPNQYLNTLILQIAVDVKVTANQ